ncbi:MAG TPA: hypothetical protein VNN09_03810 [Candidatus Competibacteraceae bacterium]|nr:hypothetical protein [Candidatus Competibacteraceae bacterium]
MPPRKPLLIVIPGGLARARAGGGELFGRPGSPLGRALRRLEACLRLPRPLYGPRPGG